jgi:phosphatidylserine/phosphatidylglycerophosphate/cardiolipin synthase-like enzyme
MKKLIAPLLLTLSIGSTAALADITPLFSPSKDVKTTIVTSIEDAAETIDVAMYSFSDAGILKALKTAAKDGKQVRLILNKAMSAKEKAQGLEDAGVDVRYVSNTMHHKFAIFDGPHSDDVDAAESKLLTGSGNWSGSSHSKYDEDLLIFTNESKFVKAYQTEFNYLWENSIEFGEEYIYDIKKISYKSSKVRFTSHNMKAVKNSRGLNSFRATVSWEDGVAGKAIIKAINGAEDTIKIATAHFRRADIADALTAALERGVKVEIVTDQQEYHSRGTASDPTFLDETIAAKGAKVRYKIYSRFWDYRTAFQMHAKYIIIDDETVITGSFNWSRNAETKVMENLVIISDSDIADAYVKNFGKIFNYGKGTITALKKKISKASGKSPCAFAPISLTGKQVKALRKLYAYGACRSR